MASRSQRSGQNPKSEVEYGSWWMDDERLEAKEERQKKQLG